MKENFLFLEGDSAEKNDIAKWQRVQKNSIPWMEFFLKIGSLMPLSWIRAAGKWAGRVWYLADPKHRKIAEENIALAYPQISRKEVQALAKANFSHLAQVFLETLAVARITPNNCGSFMNVRGLDFLNDSLKLQKGLFLLTGHIGNWEWLAYVTPFYIKNRLNIVARPLTLKPVDRFLKYLRERSGNVVIDKKNATGAIMRALERNEMVGILLDQNSGRGNGVYAPFFGVYVLTHRALASFAIKTGAPVHPAFICRETDGNYTIEIHPAVKIPAEGSIRERVRQATTLFNRYIEEQIRRHPSQWYWIHRRFKRHVASLDEIR